MRWQHYFLPTRSTLRPQDGAPGREFILESRGFTRQTFNVEGCLDSNIAYGMVTTSNGDSFVSIELDELIVPSTG